MLSIYCDRNQKMKNRLLSVYLAFICATSTLLANDKPKLVIFISVDQMRADYLRRFKTSFSGGLKRLVEEGTVFQNAFLNYAPSETGPGHATLSTGCYPWKSGILSNNWIDPTTRREVYCVTDTVAEKVNAEGGGFSPKNLEVTTVGGWLKSASPASKVIAVSIKDRAAILMGGHRADYAFWYDSQTGHLVTSEYYTKTDPAWVKSFNQANWIEHHVPAAWTTLRSRDYYLRFGPDTVEGEKPWNGSTAFPHSFSQKRVNEQILRSPYGDQLVLDFAKAAIRAEQLGQRGSIDMLCISLSCTDYIGHAFGPDSWEMADQMLRLDQSLGAFLSDAEQLIGRGNILLALSADHAVMPLPEVIASVKSGSARRILAQAVINPAIDSLDRLLEHELHTTEHIIQSNAFLNYAAASKAGIDSMELEHRVKEGLLKIDGFADIYFRRELLDPKTPDRPYLENFRRGYYATRGEDALVRFCSNCLITNSSTGASHGSVYDYDTHVPVVFWGTGVDATIVDRSIHTVDIAPTLARSLGVSFPPTIDGLPLGEVIH